MSEARNLVECLLVGVQAKGNGLTVGTVAEDGHAASVHPGQPLHEGEADPQAALGPVQGAVGLSEEVEDPREHVGVDSHAVVSNPEDHFIPLSLDREPNATAFRSVLGGIVEQVQEDLGQPGHVGMNCQRLFWE